MEQLERNNGRQQIKQIQTEYAEYRNRTSTTNNKVKQMR